MKSELVSYVQVTVTLAPSTPKHNMKPGDTSAPTLCSAAAALCGKCALCQLRTEVIW